MTLSIRYLFLLCAFLTSATVSAEVTTEEFPFCHSYSGLKEIWRAASSRDIQQYNALLKNEECVELKEGIKLSIIDKIGVIYKVRIYIGDDSFIMYANSSSFK